MNTSHRGDLGIIALGALFVVAPLVFMPRGVDWVLSALLQFVNTTSVGVVYVVFGLTSAGWNRTTGSERVPFGVAVISAGVALLAIAGVEVATVTPAPVESDTFRELFRNVAALPHIWIGYYLTCILAYTAAATSRQRAFAIAGMAVIPLLVSVVWLNEVRGLGYYFAFMFIQLSLIAILFSYVYAYPVLHLQNLTEGGGVTGN